MRRLIRSFAVVAAVAAMSIPVFGATRHASACSQPGGPVTVGSPLLGNQICFFNASGTSGVDFYTSPITGTFGTAVFSEIQTSAEPSATQVVTTAGSLTFSIDDLRGNNQGFTAFLSCSADPCLSNPYQAPYGIPASAISVNGRTTGFTYPFYGDGVGPGIGLSSFRSLSVITQLSSAFNRVTGDAVAVGGQCAEPAIGYGSYLFNVPLLMTLGFPYNEYRTLPVSFGGNFTVSVLENTMPSANCPAYSPANVVPTTSAPGVPNIVPLLQG